MAYDLTAPGKTLLPHLFILIGLAATIALGVGGEAAAATDVSGLRKDDPCRLLKAGEVEAVVGPLVVPPYRANGAMPGPRGEDCRYETAAGRSLRVNVTWEGGAQVIAMMGALEGAVDEAGLRQPKLSTGSTLAGEWDRAQVSQCCEFNALRGDRMVTVDVAGSHATIAQAADLAALAVKRLDQPLDFNGAAGIRQAQARAADRPKRRNVCELLPRADAEAIAGVPLLTPPTGSDQSCTYEWTADPAGLRYSVKLMVQWTDGFHDMRQTGSMIGQASTMLGISQGPAQNSPISNDAPWDDFSQSIIGVMAVKSDVLVSVESGPFQQDIARAFVKKAVANLSK